MPPFLGISPAATRGAPSASDVPASDTRSAPDEANGDAFRLALSAANRRSDPSERTGRKATDGPTTDTSTGDEEISADAEVEATAENVVPSDALAMLLNWTAPLPTTPAPTTPLVTRPAGSDDASVMSSPPGAATADTTAESLKTRLGGPETAPMIQGNTPMPAAGVEGAMVTDDTALLTGTPVNAQNSAFAASLDDATAQATPPTSGAITLPGDMTATTADAWTGATGSAPTTTAVTPPDAPTTTTGAPALDPLMSARLDLLATTQGAVEARAATEAQMASDATTAATTTAAGAGTTPQASTPTPTTWTDLAASFGAQIVATTGQTTPRATASGSAVAGAAPLVEAAQIPTDGSTAQAAGVSATAGVELPGQAVTTAGGPSQATAGTFAEALEAAPDGTAPVPGSAAATTELAPPAVRTDTGLGTAGINAIGQAQSTDSVETAATTAPPIANQIADGAMQASRRVGQSVEMILQPEGLGSVSLRVSIERAGLGVHIAVENAQTREMVQSSWPQIQQALEQRGLTVQSMMLDLSNDRGGNEGFQQFQQFNGQQFTGQQQQQRARSMGSDRRGAPAVGAIDESPRPQPGVATTSRVDYRL